MPAVTPSKNEILTNETSYRSAVSEAVMQKMAASINWLLEMGAVGDIVSSALTTAQFQAERSTNWVLCNGASSAGTEYESITGNTTVPDLRGEFLRGSDNGRGVDAARVLLSTQSASTFSHNHQWVVGGGGGGVAVVNSSDTKQDSYNSGGVQTAVFEGGSYYTSNTATSAYPRNVAVNFFIRVN